MGTVRTDEFRKDAVRIALTSGLSRRQVADDLGVGLSTLNKWVNAHRDAVLRATKDHPISQRRACVLIGVEPKTVRREWPPNNPEIPEKMHKIAEKRRRFGYRRVTATTMLIDTLELGHLDFLTVGGLGPDELWGFGVAAVARRNSCLAA